MSGRAERRRRKGTFLELLISDPLRKLVALGLAIGLWYYLDFQINANETRQLAFYEFNHQDYAERDKLTESQLGIPINSSQVAVRRYENADTGEEIEHVTLHFRGKRARLQALEEAPPFRIRLRELDRDVDSFQFDVNEIVTSSEIAELLVRMEPSRVRVELERLVEERMLIRRETMPIDIPPEVGVDEEDLLLSGTEFYPDEIVLRGPPSELRDTDRIRFHVAVTDFRPSKRHVVGQIELTVGEDGPTEVTLEPVKVSIPLRPETVEYRLNVRVLLDQSALAPQPDAPRFEAVEARITVTVEVEVGTPLATRVFTSIDAGTDDENEKRRRRDEWAARNLRLLVVLEEEPTGTPPWSLPARLFVTHPEDFDPDHIELKDPVTVRVRPRQGTGNEDGGER